MSWWSSSTSLGKTPLKVLVTGAGGKTGTIVVRKLLEQGKDKFTAKALVRSPESGEKLKASLSSQGTSASELDIVQGDVTKTETLGAAFAGVDAVVICTSAVPQLDKWSLPGVILTKVFTLGFVSRRPAFYFDEGGSPETVDYVGQVSQIDAAKSAGVKHIVLVSSMAGTKPDHFLNVCMEHIVLWKRKTECYLMSSGIPYTIIHPGGLLPHPPGNEPAPGGKRQLVAGVDDKLMDEEPQTRTQIPREDVAEVCVQCLLCPEAKGRSFDLGSEPEDDKPHTVDPKELLAPLAGKNCAYKPSDAQFKPEPSGKRDQACGLCSAK